MIRRITRKDIREIERRIAMIDAHTQSIKEREAKEAKAKEEGRSDERNK